MTQREDERHAGMPVEVHTLVGRGGRVLWLAQCSCSHQSSTSVESIGTWLQRQGQDSTLPRWEHNL